MDLIFLKSIYYNFYYKNILASLLMSKYCYTNVYDILELKRVIIRSKYCIKNDKISFRSILLLVYFLFFGLFKNKVQYNLQFFKKQKIKIVRDFTIFTVFEQNLAYYFIFKWRFLFKRLNYFFGFEFKQNRNNVIYKFTEIDNFIDFILYYKLRRMVRFPDIPYLEFLAVVVRRTLFLTFILNFNEVSFHLKYFFFFQFLKLPFVK